MPASPAAAQTARPAEADGWSVYAETGTTISRRFDTRTVALGATAPWPAVARWTDGLFDGYWDASIGAWRAADVSGRQRGDLLLRFVPTWRYRFGGGSTGAAGTEWRDGPWFVDVGVGVAYFDGNYDTPERRFGTRLNFAETVGIGRQFGARGQYEWSLRLQHTSNGGIKKPNPGETFVKLRLLMAL